MKVFIGPNDRAGKMFVPIDPETKTTSQLIPKVQGQCPLPLMPQRHARSEIRPPVTAKGDCIPLDKRLNLLHKDHEDIRSWRAN